MRVLLPGRRASARRVAIRVGAFAVSFAGAASAVHAQQVGVGTRVRVTAPASFEEPRVGAIAPSARDSLTLRTGPHLATVTIPIAGVTQMEVSAGTRSHALLGAGIGLLAGGAYGATQSDNTCPIAGAGCRNGNLALGGALVGTIVGGVIGWFVKTEAWRPVRVPSSVSRVRILPADGGVALALRL